MLKTRGGVVADKSIMEIVNFYVLRRQNDRLVSHVSSSCRMQGYSGSGNTERLPSTRKLKHIESLCEHSIRGDVQASVSFLQGKHGRMICVAVMTIGKPMS